MVDTSIRLVFNLLSVLPVSARARRFRRDALWLQRLRHASGKGASELTKPSLTKSGKTTVSKLSGEISLKKARVEGASHATLVPVEEGVLPGVRALDRFRETKNVPMSNSPNRAMNRHAQYGGQRIILQC